MMNIAIPTTHTSTMSLYVAGCTISTHWLTDAHTQKQKLSLSLKMVPRWKRRFRSWIPSFQSGSILVFGAVSRSNKPFQTVHPSEILPLQHLSLAVQPLSYDMFYTFQVVKTLVPPLCFDQVASKPRDPWSTCWIRPIRTGWDPSFWDPKDARKKTGKTPPK